MDLFESYDLREDNKRENELIKTILTIITATLLLCRFEYLPFLLFNSCSLCATLFLLALLDKSARLFVLIVVKVLLVLSKVLAVLTVFLDGVDTFDIVILDGIVLLLFVVGRFLAALCGLFIQKFKKIRQRTQLSKL